jgi:hypothetical protein
MRSLTCWSLRERMTRYADDELPVAEHGTVEQHLACCEACRQRVRIESAVRRSLRDRTARAGSAWWARPEFPRRRSVVGVGRATLVAAVTIVLVLGVSYWFRAVPVEAEGVISDSYCRGIHRPPETPNAEPRACTHGCIRKGAHYMFVSGDRTYTIRNQDFSGLIAAAGQVVHVSGAARGQQLTLAHMVAVKPPSGR